MNITNEEYKILFRKNKRVNIDNFRKSEEINYKISNDKFNRILVDLNMFREIIRKVMKEVEAEKDRLFMFYVCFYELFKIFKSNFFEIVRVSNLYKEKIKYCGYDLESELNSIDKKIIKKNLCDRLGIIQKSGFLNFYIKRDGQLIIYNGVKYKNYKNFENFVLVYMQDNYDNGYGLDFYLYKKVIFDIDVVNGYLGMCIKIMLQCLELMDEMYEELLTFKKIVEMIDYLI